MSPRPRLRDQETRTKIVATLGPSSRDVDTLRAMIREILPFFGALLVALLLITLVPEFVLYLPRQFGYAAFSCRAQRGINFGQCCLFGMPDEDDGCRRL